MDLPAWVSLKRLGGVGRLRRFAGLLGGAILLQTTGGCDQALSNFAGALGQPVATGIGDGLSDLLQVMVVSVIA